MKECQHTWGKSNKLKGSRVSQTCSSCLAYSTVDFAPPTRHIFPHKGARFTWNVALTEAEATQCRAAML